MNPGDLTTRSQQLSPFNGGLGNPIGALLINAWEHLLVFGVRGDQLPRYNFAGQPMLNPWQAVFFWLGVGFAMYRWRQSPANRLLFLWLIVMIPPAMLARTDGQGPNSLRMIGAAPAVYLLIGSGVWEAYRFVWSRRLSLRWRKRPGLTEQEAGIAAEGAVVMAGLILLQGLATYRTFFVEWAAELGFNRAYHAEWAEAAEALNELESDSDMVYILPYPLHNEHFSDRHFGFEYLYQGAAPTYVLAALTPHNLARKVEKVLSEDGMFSTVRFLDWRNQLVGGDARAEEHTLSLLWKYGRYRGSDEYESFHNSHFRGHLVGPPMGII